MELCTIITLARQTSSVNVILKRPVINKGPRCHGVSSEASTMVFVTVDFDMIFFFRGRNENEKEEKGERNEKKENGETNEKEESKGEIRGN